MLDRATRERQLIRIGYAAPERARTERRLHPLGLWFWGTSWTLVAWCELREDFRMFRVDRITALEPTAERFEIAPERSLAAYLDRIENEEGCALPPDPLL